MQSLLSGRSNKQWSRWYSLYVLIVLMVMYTLSQTDRFVLGISSYKISHELAIGHKTCYFNDTDDGSCSHINCSVYTNNKTCSDADHCMWDYTATSVYYQVLAGPAFIVTFALFSMPMGFIATVPVVRRSTLLSLCAIMWSIIVGVTGFTSIYWQILLARIALGIFQAACTPFAGSIITDVFSEKSRGVAFGFYSWGVYVGYSLAFAFNFIVHDLSWRWAFWILSLLGIASSVVALFTIKEPSRKAIVANDEDDNGKKHKFSFLKLFKRVLMSYLQVPLLLLCIGAGLRQGGGLVWAYNAKAFFRRMHCDEIGVGIYLSWVPVVGGSIGVFVGGWISDILVHRWGMKARIIVLVLCNLLASPFLFGTLYSPPPWSFLSLLFAYVSGEMWFGVCIAVAIEMVPRDVASTSLALYLLIINLIGGNLNLALPYLEKTLGLQPAMIVLFPVTYIVAAVLFAIAGLLWATRSSRCCRKQVDVVNTEKEQLIVNNIDNFESTSLTESQDIERRLSKRNVPGRPGGIKIPSIASIDFMSSLTASI